MKNERILALILTVIISFNILLILNSMRRIGFEIALITFSILFLFLAIGVGAFFIADLKKNNNLTPKTKKIVLLIIILVPGLSVGGAVILYKALAIASGYPE
ncbi:hypothetical protein [Desulforamulus aquiferis]|uniref:Uncharacterized protein n=1 Tax=Desulforamulus aquiferis TaxID=1397668 RepID=A0AAW7ZA24_9FIRM|nr:hypothetical protein [Desulforamulus aquiferis]MDO7786320.1 hypothetical protein [Desulforamulus aquiferis]RYD06164.1 hypothetical protein N752_04555 [Desulforamulus aquiferis]